MRNFLLLALFSVLLVSCGVADSSSQDENLLPSLSSQQQNSVTVHFKKPAGWSGAYIHYWGDVSTSWNNCPAMSDEGDGWYSYTIEGVSSINLLFKAYSGHTGTKTADQNNISGGYYVLEDDTWYSEKPIPADGITVHFKKPDNWNGAYIHYWGTVSSNWNNCPAMTPEGDGWYSYKIENVTKSNLLFKAYSGHTGIKTTDQMNVTGGYYVLEENLWYAEKPIPLEGLHIVVIGSSTAEGVGPDYAWVDRFRDHVQWVNPANRVTNLAKSGYNSYRYLPTGSHVPSGQWVDTERNITKALSLSPDIILLNNPSNDVWVEPYSIDTVMNNYHTIVNTAQNAGVEIYLTTSQPTLYDQDKRNRLILQKDRTFSEFPSIVIDFWNGLANSDGTTKEEFRVDGDWVHVNDNAHRLFTQRVKELNLLDDPIPQGKTIHYYSSSFSQTYIHYRNDNDAWTSAPGVLMNNDGGNWFSIYLDDQDKMDFVFNNGSGWWDNNNHSDYNTIEEEIWIKDNQIFTSQP
jgi:hypothetical protein